MSTLLFLYLAAGILLILLSIPLLLEKIRPNPLYGFRVSQTLDDPRVWYAANKYAAKRLMAAWASIVIAAAGLYFIPGISVDAYALACLTVFVLVFIARLARSFRYIRYIAEKQD